MADKLTEEISGRFNTKLSDYLPFVHFSIKELIHFKEVIEMKFNNVERDSKEIMSYKVDLSNIKDMKFEV